MNLISVPVAAGHSAANPMSSRIIGPDARSHMNRFILDRKPAVSLP